MSTISTAVQELVNGLTAKMKSGQPYTPEEQLLVTKAISNLQDNQSWEQALVAVAEQHINSASSALNTASTQFNQDSNSGVSALQAAESSLTNKTQQLDLLPKLSARSNSDHRVGVAYIGAQQTSNRKNSAFRAPVHSSHIGEALCPPFMDLKTGKMYVAYMTIHTNTAHHLNIHFGYWKKGVFTTLYRYVDTSTSTSGIFSHVDDRKRQYTWGCIVPLAKSDDKEDVRISLILASSYLVIGSNNFSWRSVVSVKSDDSALHIYQGQHANKCDLGNKDVGHPLAVNSRHAAYDRLNRVFVGYNGSLQYWDGAFGLGGISDTLDTNANTGPTYEYPAAEIRKLNQYIEFTCHRQNGMPLFGRFALSLGAGSDGNKSAFRRSIMDEFGGNTGEFWYNAPSAQFYFSNNNSFYVNANANYRKGSYFSETVHVYTHLVGLEDDTVSLQQIYYEPVEDIKRSGEDSATYMEHRIVGLRLSVLDEEGKTVLKGQINRPLKADSANTTNIDAGQEYLFLPTCYNPIDEDLHVLRQCQEYGENTNWYQGSTLMYRM